MPKVTARSLIPTSFNNASTRPLPKAGAQSPFPGNVFDGDDFPYNLEYIYTSRLALGSLLPLKPSYIPNERSPVGSGLTGGLSNDDRFHLIVADGAQDVRIDGSGIIDGNGSAWYPPAEADCPWPLGYEDAKRMAPMVEIYNCTHVHIEGVTLTNVGFWTLHLHESDRVRVQGIRIRNPGIAPNSDGIDISGCRGVWISHCDIDTGDDGICVKTLPNGRTSEDIFVDNCRVKSDCVGLKIGANETYQDIRRVHFTNCTVTGSHRAIGVYTFRGKTIEDVSFENIHCDTHAPLMFTRPIHIDVRRGSGQRDDSGSVGTVQHIRLRGITAITNGRCLLSAEPGSHLRYITLEDICLRYPTIDDPMHQGTEHGGMQFSPGVPWSRTARAAFVCANVHNSDMRHVKILWPQDNKTPEEWTWPRKAANGTLRWFKPEDWQLAPQTKFAAILTENCSGLNIDPSLEESSFEA